MKEREVIGSVEALAFLFSGGHFINVSQRPSREDRIKRRKAIFGGWSRAIMGKLPHPLATARDVYAAAHGGRVSGNRAVRKFAESRR